MLNDLFFFALGAVVAVVSPPVFNFVTAQVAKIKAKLKPTE